MREHSERRDRLADEVARALAPRLDDLVDALMADLRDLEPVVAQWSPRVREAVRANLRAVAEGFVAFLPLGDLEAGEVERLRTLLDLPLPGTRAETGLGLLPPLRLHALEAIGQLVGDEVDPAALRVLERELERYVALLHGLDRHPARLQPGDLDQWLAEIEASGGGSEAPLTITVDLDGDTVGVASRPPRRAQ